MRFGLYDAVSGRTALCAERNPLLLERSLLTKKAQGSVNAHPLRHTVFYITDITLAVRPGQSRIQPTPPLFPAVVPSDIF